MNKEAIIKKGKAVVEIIFLFLLLVYPMRHVSLGGDLWDAGYNYGNFMYPEVERIGKTWFFSTYLANGIGHLLTLLPGGHTWIGLNMYTGLFSSLLAIGGYLFCTRTLKVSPVLAFAGEMIALSMCWCPTALLYNYLTYVLFSGCLILLYLGLTKEKNWMLALAGAFLGVNVFVRFSNLPEMGMILAVWAYAFWDGWKKQDGWFGKVMGTILKKTLWCLLGYLAALVVFFAWIAVRYGIGEYVEGIRLLFAMTDTATDYKPASMIYGLIWPYKEGLRWVVRLGFFSVVALIVRMITDYVPLCLPEKSRSAVQKVFDFVGLISTAAVAILMVLWMFLQRENQPNLTSFLYTSYDPIYWPGTLFLMLAMAIGAIEVVRPGNTKENRFLGLSVILLVILTSLGSNNGIYPSMNHLFLPAPYVLWKVGEFTFYHLKKSAKKAETIAEFKISLVPLGVTVWAFLFVCGMQFFLFGRYFVFCEGTGMKEAGYIVEQNEALTNVQMSRERAMLISNLSMYVQEKNLTGQEVILHGWVPALSFYLQMPPAFHSWNDLDSFSYETMQKTLEELMKDVSEKGRKKPVVIAAADYEPYGPVTPEQEGAEEISEDPKWELIRKFMGLYGYEETFLNDRFVMWQAVE